MLARNFTASQSNNWLAHYAPGGTAQKDGNEGERLNLDSSSVNFPHHWNLFLLINSIQHGNKSHAFEMHSKTYYIYPVDQI